MRRHAVGEVAGRRAGEHVEPELEGPCGGNRHDAVLVGQRRMIHRIVLDVDLAHAKTLGEPPAAHERREA